MIYGDTDSIMIDTATTVYEDVRKVGAAVKAEVIPRSTADMCQLRLYRKRWTT